MGSSQTNMAAVGTMAVRTLLFVLCLGIVKADRLKYKIYQDIQGDMACFKRFNGTHEVGCTSKFWGNVGVIHLVTLMATAEALFRYKEEVKSSDNEKNIVFFIFQGESWDYIGSSRVV